MSRSRFSKILVSPTIVKYIKILFWEDLSRLVEIIPAMHTALVVSLLHWFWFFNCLSISVLLCSVQVLRNEKNLSCLKVCLMISLCLPMSPWHVCPHCHSSQQGNFLPTFHVIVNHINIKFEFFYYSFRSEKDYGLH